MLINPHPYSTEGPRAPLNNKPWLNMKAGKDLLGLVDADMFVYAAGFSCEHSEPLALDKDGNLLGQWKGKSDYNKWLKENPDVEHDLDFYEWLEPVDSGYFLLNQKRKMIREMTHGCTQRWYLTKGSTLWRLEDAGLQEYKGNRKATSKPVYYDDLRSYMQRSMKAKILQGLEADDGVAALARENPGQVLVVSGDKDLKTVAGLHLNPSKMDEGIKFISELEACRFLYGQMLSGDKIDNIKGLSGEKGKPGWGPVKAAKAMAQYDNEYDMAMYVAQQYEKKFPDGFVGWRGDEYTWQEVLCETANLLFLRRYRDTRFTWEQ